MDQSHSERAGTEVAKTDELRRYNILVCVDGSDESLAALRYAVRIGSGNDADLTLLYVRPADQSLTNSGLQMSMARENILNWGLELPGIKTLKKARDRLVDMEWLGEDWEETFSKVSESGDHLGDNIITYTNDEGRHITLKLRVGRSVARGILEECAEGNYDITIVAKANESEPTGLGYITPEDADRVALEHTGTVLVTKMLEENHGHLLCVTDDEGSIRAARQDAVIAARCMCPVYLFSVAKDESEVEAARHAVAEARKEIEAYGIKPSGEKVVIGNPVEEIVEEGKKYSVIVLSRFKPNTSWLRMFSNSISEEILARAHNSVMIHR